jgi:hypothetical protein
MSGKKTLAKNKAQEAQRIAEAERDEMKAQLELLHEQRREEKRLQAEQLSFSTPKQGAVVSGSKRGAGGGGGGGDTSKTATSDSEDDVDDDFSSVSSEGFMMNFENMSFDELEPHVSSYAESTLKDILPSIKNYVKNSSACVAILRAFCVVGQALELRKLQNNGVVVSRAELKYLFRSVPTTTDATLTLNSDQQQDVKRCEVSALSESKILAFFEHADGSNILDNANHWTMPCQRQLEKCVSETLKSSTISAKALLHGTFPMALQMAPCAPWKGETSVAQNGAAEDDDDDEELGFLFTLKRNDALSNRSIPSSGKTDLYRTLSSKEKSFPNLLQRDEIPDNIRASVQTLLVTLTRTLASGKSQLSPDALVVAKKWDSAQKALLQTCKVILRRLANNRNSEIATEASVALTNTLSEQGDVTTSDNPFVFPTLVGMLLKQEHNIDGGEGAYGVRVLQEVLNRGSELGGVQELVALVTETFNVSKGLTNYIITMRDKAIAAQEACKPNPLVEGPNPACTDEVALWVTFHRVSAAMQVQGKGKGISQAEKKFIKKLVKSFNESKIRDFTTAIKAAQKAEKVGLLVKTPTPAAGGAAYMGAESQKPPGSESEYNPRDHPISFKKYAEAVTFLIGQIQADDSEVETWLDKIVHDELPDGCAYRLKVNADPAIRRKFEYVYIPKSITGDSKWAATILHKALSIKDKQYVKSIALADLVPASKAEQQEKSDAAKSEAAKKSKAAADRRARVETKKVEKEARVLAAAAKKLAAQEDGKSGKKSKAAAAAEAQDKTAFAAVETELAMTKKKLAALESAADDEQKKVLEQRLSAIEGAVLHQGI